MIMPAVVHAFAIVFAELEALRAKPVELAAAPPAVATVPAGVGTAPVPDARP